MQPKFFFFWQIMWILSSTANGQPSKNNVVLSSEQSTINCIYRITFRPDSTSNNTRVEYARLLIGKNLSKFETIGSYRADSIRSMYPAILTAENTNPQEYADKMLSLPQTKFHYFIYKTPAIGRLYCYDRINSALYTYIEPDNVFHWTINSEQSTIAGYVCQRATVEFAGRVFEAWFTREIPLSEGPYKFYGLPGLIVKISDIHNYYLFELVKLIKTSNPVRIALPVNRAALTTKMALYKGQAAYNLRLAERLAQMGNNISVVERQRMKKPITPLELR